MPIGQSHRLSPGHDRKPDRVIGADAAGGLVSICDAIELDADLARRNVLNRQLDVDKAERGIVVRALLVKVERADLAMHTRAELAVPRHLRIGPRRCSRGQGPERTELSVRIALSHAFLPDLAIPVVCFASQGVRFRKRAALAANVSRLASSACSANCAGRSCLIENG